MPPVLAEDIESWACGLCTTLPDELVFKVLKGAGRLSPNGRLSRLSRWAVADQSSVLPDLGYPRLEPGLADRVEGHGQSFDESSFHCDGEQAGDGCGPYEFLDPPAQESLEFPTIEPYQWNLFAMKWQVALATPDKTALVENGWLSMLIPPGSVVRHVPTKTVFGMAVHSTQWGCLALPLLTTRVDSTKVLVQLKSPSKYTAFAVTDLENYAILRLRAVAPVEQARMLKDAGQPAQKPHLCWQRDGKPLTLLKAAALHGFRHIAVRHLHALVTRCEVPYDPPRPKTEMAFCELLIKWCWLDLSEAELEALLALRGGRMPSESILESPGVMEMASAFFDEADQEDAGRAVEAVQKSRAIRSKPQQERATASGAGRPASSSTGGPASSSSKPKPSTATGSAEQPKAVDKKPFLLADAKGEHAFDADSLKDLLPAVQGCTCAVEDKWHLRWRSFYPSPDLPRHCSKVFEDLRSEPLAVCHVLKFVWARHEQLTGEKCWFNIGDELFSKA